MNINQLIINTRLSLDNLSSHIEYLEDDVRLLQGQIFQNKGDNMHLSGLVNSYHHDNVQLTGKVNSYHHENVQLTVLVKSLVERTTALEKTKK